MKNFKITIFIALTLGLHQHIDSMHEAIDAKSKEIPGGKTNEPGSKTQEPSAGKKNLMNRDSSMNKNNSSENNTTNTQTQEANQAQNSIDTTIDMSKMESMNKDNSTDEKNSENNTTNTQTPEANPPKKGIQTAVDMTMDTLNITQDLFSGETQARTYDPYDVKKSDPNGPIMTKTKLKDGSEIRTYLDHDNNPISTNITNSSNSKASTNINYNLDGTVSYIADLGDGAGPRTVQYKNKKTSTVDNTQSKANTTTNLFSSPKAEKAPSVKSTDSTTQSNKQASTKAPDDIRAKADQFKKLDNYTGDINAPIIDMYKKPGETVTETNNSITHDNSGEIFNYKSTLSDGTSVLTQLRPGEGGPKLMSTDVTNSSGRTNVKYNADGSKTEIFTPKDGSAQRTVTYNKDGSVKLQDKNGTKEFTKDEAAAKKTGIAGKLNWLQKRSTEAYESGKSLLSSSKKTQSNPDQSALLDSTSQPVEKNNSTKTTSDSTSQLFEATKQTQTTNEQLSSQKKPMTYGDAADKTVQLFNIPESSIQNSQARHYNPDNVSDISGNITRDPSKPLMAKITLKDGSTLRTYFDNNGNPTSSNVVNTVSSKTISNTSYNPDGTVSHTSYDQNGSSPQTIKYKNTNEFQNAMKKPDTTTNNQNPFK